MWNIRMECRRRRIPDVKHPGGMAAEHNSGCDTSRWNFGRDEFRMWDIQVECRRSRILDVLSESLAKVHKPCYVIPTACHLSGFAYGKGLQSFGSSCFWAFHWFAMDSKELSSISYWFGDQKSIKTPKLNTIWLELIARVLNMLIGLKGDNYYSKVFKRVNYKLWNSTFWVVITSSKNKESNKTNGTQFRARMRENRPKQCDVFHKRPNPSHPKCIASFKICHLSQCFSRCNFSISL